jgi:hypothetical protein
MDASIHATNTASERSYALAVRLPDAADAGFPTIGETAAASVDDGAGVVSE